jgi:hypothetical protein
MRRLEYLWVSFLLMMERREKVSPANNPKRTPFRVESDRANLGMIRKTPKRQTNANRTFIGSGLTLKIKGSRKAVKTGKLE